MSPKIKKNVKDVRRIWDYWGVLTTQHQNLKNAKIRKKCIYWIFYSGKYLEIFSDKDDHGTFKCIFNTEISKQSLIFYKFIDRKSDEETQFKYEINQKIFFF